MLRLLLSAPLSDAELAPWVTPEEVAAAAVFAPARRREWLSWRALVRRTLKSDSLTFSYNDIGAPLIQGAPLFLSVSHCAGSIAVAFSESPCAVDVETLDRDFGRVASRYMTPAERALSADPHWPALVWCAKECLCKFAARRGLDLLADLRVEAVDFAARTLSARVLGAEPPVTLRFMFIAGRAVVFTA